MGNSESWVAEDPRKYQITLSSKRYHEHIVEQSGHDEILPTEIIDAVKEPAFIYQSSRYADRDVYFSRSSATYPYLYVKVAVKMDEKDKTGDVKTAFLTKGISGGIKKDGLKYAYFSNSQL